MSLSDAPVAGCSTRRSIVIALCCGLGLVTAGCTVAPLYSSLGRARPIAAATGATVGVKPVGDRVAQQVRNRLVFLLDGGAAEPSDPDYELTLSVSTATTGSATALRSGNYGPVAGNVTVTASYTIVDKAGKAVFTGKRAASAAFDRPEQQYALIRAERDAEDRAAREVAEALHLAIASDLETKR